MHLVRCAGCAHHACGTYECPAEWLAHLSAAAAEQDAEAPREEEAEGGQLAEWWARAGYDIAAAFAVVPAEPELDRPLQHAAIMGCVGGFSHAPPSLVIISVSGPSRNVQSQLGGWLVHVYLLVACP